MQNRQLFLHLYTIITFAGRLTAETGTFQENKGFCAIPIQHGDNRSLTIDYKKTIVAIGNNRKLISVLLNKVCVDETVTYLSPR